MKILELIESAKNADTKGTYVGVKFDDASLDALMNFVEDNNIPNPLTRPDFHSTVVYSRKHLPDYEPLGSIDPTWKAKPTGFEIWESKPNAYKKEHTFCLVMKIDCSNMVDRHNSARDDHGATYDFDEYKPHVTLSYDVGEDFSEDDLTWSGEPLGVSTEYTEDLDLDKSYD